MRWGKLRRGAKATHEPRRGGGKHSSTKYNSRREFDEYSEDEYSDDSQQEELFDVDDEVEEQEEEESMVSWDQRGDRAEFRAAAIRNDVRDDVVADDYVEDEELTLDEFREGDEGGTNELVTRDQVLDELRAQAAADALGKSLEQMGYNLDNCDSFYSLSGAEQEQDQRYSITQINSEVSESASPSKRRQRKSKKKKKAAKKKAKSSRSRYAGTSDEDDEEDSTTQYGDPTHTLGGRHSFGDYDTFISTSSEDSEDDDSYFEDETSFTTGQVSALTGKTSRFSRFTGKKSAKTRKSFKTKHHKKRLRGGDHETYYSRGTEWTHGDDSSNSTLSSVSSVSELDSELDGETMYTELSRKRDRLKKKMHSKVRSKSHPNRRKAAGRMTEIDEDMEYVSPKKMNKHRHHHHQHQHQHQHQHHRVQPKNEKRNVRNKIAGPSDMSVESDSSMIGAMRSLDSTVADESPIDDEDKQETGKVLENNVDKTSPSKGPKKPMDAVLSEEEVLLKNIAKNSPRKNSETLEELKKSSRTSNKEQETEVSSKRHDNEDDGSDSEEKNGRQQSDKKKRRNSKSASASRDDGSAREQKKSSKHSRDEASDEKDTVKKSTEKSSRGDKKTGGIDRPPMPTKANKGSKKSSSEKRQSKLAEEPAKSGAKESSSVANMETGSTGKKFWPRQFLSLRKKKNESVPIDSEKVEVDQTKLLDKEAVSDSDDNDDATPEKEQEKEDTQRKSRKDKSKSSRQRKSRRERSKSRETRDRSKSRDARDRSSSPSRLEKETSALNETTKSSDSRRKATKERETKEKDSTDVIREIIDSKGCAPMNTNEETEQSIKQGKSLGILDMAAMAAMIPLVPIAAAYSCYTADSTQSMLKSVKTTCAECKTDGVQAYAECKNDDDDSIKQTTDDERSSKRRSRKYMESIFHSDMDDDDDDSAKSENESPRSTKPTTPKAIEQTKAIAETDENHGDTLRDEFSESKSKRCGSSATSRSKKALTKILPRSSGKYDPPQTHIQEATEGFESFLPPQGQCLPDPTSPVSQGLTTIIPGSAEIQNLPSPQQMPKKKTKKWTIPKLHFGLHKKAEDKKTEAGTLTKNTMVLPPATESTNPSHGKGAPAPFLKPSSQKPSPIVTNPAATRKKAATKKARRPSTAPDAKLGPFSCSQPSPVCGKVDLEPEVPFVAERDLSLLSDFENLALDALKKKSQQSQTDKANGTPDPAKATQEDLLNYYDLGQTLSDVIDARQTLEQAYGMHSGGASFDHTIDEQLVELLAHMAEMDQEDVVEIEEAIKKLKRHALKLGISERDLLFSVKSQDGTLSVADDDFLHRGSGEEEEEAPPASFGDKMYDALFWRK